MGQHQISVISLFLTDLGCDVYSIAPLTLSITPHFVDIRQQLKQMKENNLGVLHCWKGEADVPPAHATALQVSPIGAPAAGYELVD